MKLILKAYIERITKTIFNELGFNDNTDDTRLEQYLRWNLLNWVCRVGNSDCINEARKQFDNYKTLGVK